MNALLVLMLVVAGPRIATEQPQADPMATYLHLRQLAAEEHTAPPVAIEEPWASLAQCESHGEWDYGPHSGWGNGLFQGGLQFHPDTWDGFKPSGYPAEAYQATPEQQIHVAEKVLAAQGWRAWPACSKKLGYR